MSIKAKMRSLIAAANDRTGKSDADLTAAVQSLIAEPSGITPSGNKAITATTSTLTDIDVTNYATVSVDPTPSEALVAITNGDVRPSSGRLISLVTVDVPTGEARTSSDITVSGATVNVPAGLYSSAASKSVASGTAGTPTASKGAVSNNSVTVTPSVANTTGYITGGTKTGTGVTVSASELVSGNKALTPSETAQSGIDVTNFKTVSVGAISSTYVGSGVTKKAAATVAPSTSEQTVCASGVYTTGEQKVSAITPSIVGNLDASSFAASIVAAIEGKSVTVPTGTKLSGLAALIESIQTGGSTPEQIAFIINDAGISGSNSETFIVPYGTTWEEWVGPIQSILNNTIELYINDGRVTDENGVKTVSLDGSTAVSSSDAIISGATYTIINYSGGAVTQISFNIVQNDGGEITDRGSFTVNSGTTWAEWIGSGYTFDDGLMLVVSGGQVVHNEGVYVLQYINDGDPVTSTNGRAVSSSDAIISGTTYKLQNLYL